MEKRNLKRAPRFKGHNTFAGIIRLIGINRVRKAQYLLDIGAGDGFIVRRLKKINPKAEIIGIDPDPKNDAVTKGVIEKTGLPNGYFDLVICTDVIEHLPDRILSDGLREIARILRKDGIACFSTLLQEDLDKKTEQCPQCGHVFHHVGHIQSFSRSELVTRLNKAGLGVTKIRVMNLTLYSSHPFLYQLADSLFFILPAEIKKLMRKDIIIICHKKSNL